MEYQTPKIENIYLEIVDDSEYLKPTVSNTVYLHPIHSNANAEDGLIQDSLNSTSFTTNGVEVYQNGYPLKKYSNVAICSNVSSEVLPAKDSGDADSPRICSEGGPGMDFDEVVPSNIYAEVAPEKDDCYACSSILELSNDSSDAAVSNTYSEVGLTNDSGDVTSSNAFSKLGLIKDSGDLNKEQMEMETKQESEQVKNAPSSSRPFPYLIYISKWGPCLARFLLASLIGSLCGLIVFQVTKCDCK